MPPRLRARPDPGAWFILVEGGVLAAFYAITHRAEDLLAHVCDLARTRGARPLAALGRGQRLLRGQMTRAGLVSASPIQAMLSTLATASSPLGSRLRNARFAAPCRHSRRNRIDHRLARHPFEASAGARSTPTDTRAHCLPCHEPGGE